MNQQQGFTLIELVMVIVILGILASFAVPRFADITVDARESAINGMAGSMRAAAALAKSTALVQSRSSGATISMDGVDILMSNFYPTASTGGIGAALADTSGFTAVASGTTIIDYRLIAAPTPATCFVRYISSASTAPSISVSEGCGS